MLPDPGGRVKIGNNCFIGYNAVILKANGIDEAIYAKQNFTSYPQKLTIVIEYTKWAGCRSGKLDRPPFLFII